MVRPIATLALAALVAACAASAEESGPKRIAPPARIPAPAVADQPDGDPVSSASIPREVRRAVVADAAKRFAVAESSVVLAHVEKVTWPDGSLGCPEPGRMYTQALVPGFRVIASTTAGDLLYHTDARGNVRNCLMPPPRVR